MENGNQNATASPPASTGVTIEDIEARLAESEKRSEGLKRDLQQERRKRQELEQLVRQPDSSSGTKSDVNTDELGQVLNPYIDPLKKKVEASEAFAQQYIRDKTLEHLSQKTGKSVDSVLKDTAMQDRLISIARRFNLVGNDYEVAQRAYEIMELEDLRLKEVDRKRQSQASANDSLPGGVPPASTTSSKTYSAEDFERMSPREYGELSKTGDFRKVNGNFVYTPHK